MRAKVVDCRLVSRALRDPTGTVKGIEKSMPFKEIDIEQKNFSLRSTWWKKKKKFYRIHQPKSDIGGFSVTNLVARGARDKDTTEQEGRVSEEEEEHAVGEAFRISR